MRVTLLSQDHCESCVDAKQLLERLAAEYPLEIVEIDLGSPEGQRLAAAKRVMFAPGVLLDDQLYGYGRPSERRLRRELERRLA